MPLSSEQLSDLERAGSLLKQGAISEDEFAALKARIMHGKPEPVVSYEDSELFAQAVRIVVFERNSSTSNLQRKLKIGFARAGHLIDLLEEEGVVGPLNAAQPREILISKPEYARRYGNNSH